jgi:hypothetical protein
LPAGLRVIAGVLFLVFSIAMWAALPAALYAGLFFIPNLICVEHIASKLFAESFGKSISDEDFSVLRIAVGAFLSLLLLIMLGGLLALAVWLLS